MPDVLFFSFGSQSGDHQYKDVQKVAIIPRKVYQNLAINQK
jgi:hypothetical protein